MRNKILSIPDGHVLSTFEIVFLIIILFYFSVISFHYFGRIVEIPLVPKKVVLKSAFVYRSISEVSKTTSNLYLRIGPDDEAYEYVIEASTRAVKHLDFSKSRKLWVAVEPDRSKRFIWGVYDDELGLLISRKDILEWAQYSNSVNYFLIVTLGIGFLYLLFVLFKNGVWNRLLAKRIARENRSD
ncbi:hypothetical protein [Pseudomonas sp. O230]|uniref:hypothetical protein n=1 Tax=Pseudomonas sp. O230 TaxID=3159450 RepID=UPI00387A8B6C